VAYLVPPLPEAATMNVNTPTYGASTAALAEATANLIQGRFLRRFTHNILLPVESHDWIGSTGSYYDARVRFVLGPSVQKLWISMWVLATADKGTSAAISASLYHFPYGTGAQIGTTTTWSQTNGYLQAIFDSDNTYFKGATSFADTYIETGFSDDTTRPHLIDVGSNQGSEVELYLNFPSYCRVYSVTIAEVA